jgi:hypothetical protein
LCGQTLRSFFVVGASRCVCLSAPPPLACATAGYSQLRVSRHNALVASYRRARALSLSLDDCTKRDSSMVFSQVVQIIIIITTTPYLVAGFFLKKVVFTFSESGFFCFPSFLC